MITADDYRRITIALGQTALDDIDWAMNDCKRPETAEEMAREINSTTGEIRV